MGFLMNVIADFVNPVERKYLTLFFDFLLLLWKVIVWHLVAILH